jgi:hypothetical protein
MASPMTARRIMVTNVITPLISVRLL